MTVWRRACASSLPRRERGRVQPPPPPLPRSGCELRLVPEAALGALLAEATRSGPHVRRPCCPPELAPPARPRRPPAAALAGETGRPHFAACGRPSRPCWKSSPGTVTPRVPVGVRTAVRTCARHGPAQGLEAKTRCRGLPPARSRRAFEATGGLCALDWGRLWPPSSLAASYGRRATQPRARVLRLRRAAPGAGRSSGRSSARRTEDVRHPSLRPPAPPTRGMLRPRSSGASSAGRAAGQGTRRPRATRDGQGRQSGVSCGSSRPRRGCGGAAAPISRVDAAQALPPPAALPNRGRCVCPQISVCDCDLVAVTQFPRQMFGKRVADKEAPSGGARDRELPRAGAARLRSPRRGCGVKTGGRASR